MYRESRPNAPFVKREGKTLWLLLPDGQRHELTPDQCRRVGDSAFNALNGIYFNLFNAGPPPKPKVDMEKMDAPS